jgi:hypothetical protein
MAVTASQATQLVQAYQATLNQQQTAILESRYADVFTQIANQAKLGANTVAVTITGTQYQELRTYLIGLGYTVSLPQTDLTQAGQRNMIITWPSLGPQAITAISPQQILALVGTAVDTALTPQGGVAPYTFSVQGALPPGLTFGANQAQVALQITGTPTQTAVTTVTVSATDAAGMTFTQIIGISIGATANPSTYVLPLATTTTLGGVQVDGVTLKVVNGTISLQSSPFLSQIARNIAVATTIGLT